MADAAPHVPTFAWLAVFNSVAYSTFGAAIPLLPLMLPVGSSLTDSSLLLVAFIVPALLLHPLVSMKLPRTTLSSLIGVGGLLAAGGTLGLGIALASPGLFGWFAQRQSHEIGVRLAPRCMRSILSVSMCVSGAGAAMCQFGLVRLVDESMIAMPSERKRRVVGVHLAFVESCIAFGSTISPLLFSFFGTTRENVNRVFLVSGITQLCLAVFIAVRVPIETREVLRTRSASVDVSEHLAEIGENDNLLSSRGPTYGALQENRGPIVSTGQQADSRREKSTDNARIDHGGSDSGRGEDVGILHALSHPWVWVILLSMFLAASSASFLRPILTPRITDDLGMSRLHAAFLFSLTALVAFLSESLSSTILSVKLGIRNTVILGILVSLAGFHLLGASVPIGLAVMFIVAGTSSSLVMTVTDLSQTTNFNFANVTNTLSLISAVTFSIGEMCGVLGAGMLQDHGGSFTYAVAKWYKFMTVACALVVAPYVIGICLQFLSPWICMARTGRRTQRRPDPQLPILPELLS